MRTCRQRALRRGEAQDARHLWRLPTAVAVTTALAQGGALTTGGAVPLGATPIDQITLATAIPPNGSVAFAIPAIPAGKIGGITALGIDTSDAANTQFQTRINGVGVPPFNPATGSPGPTAAPPALGTPIALSGGDVFDVFVTDLSGAGLTVSVRIQGFFF